MGDPIVISGAGCAGLSLAVRLADRVPERRIVVVDRRTDLDGRDRTWCSWRFGSTPFDSAVRHTWHSWSVELDGRENVAYSRDHPYQCIPGSVFYDLALSRLASKSNVELSLGVRVEGAEERDSDVIVRTDQGVIEASLVFDSRPRPRAEGGLVQTFRGLEVRTEPVFDPGRAFLMHFEDDDRGIRFMYVLPFSRTEALVEATAISATSSANLFRRHREAVPRFLARRFGIRDFDVTRQEVGVIPMAPMRVSGRPSRVVPIGIAGGMIRPSTGYAFDTIQLRTSHLAEQVAAGAPQIRDRDFRLRTRWLDDIFLRYLRRHPERGPELFSRMLSGTSGDVQARFLSDRASWIDVARVVWALPKKGLLVEAVRGMWSTHDSAMAGQTTPEALEAP